MAASPRARKAVSLFSYLTDSHRDLIKSNCRRVSFKKGSIVLTQDEDSFDLYVILSGRAAVSLMHENGREVVLDTLRDGDFFGELSLLDNRRRSATVSALTDLELLFLSRESFLKIIETTPVIAIDLLSVMATRLRKANESIETLTFLDVAGRVSKTLIQIAKTSGEKMPDGSVKIICPTHQAIANKIGASREAVTKALKALVSNGLINVNGRQAVISPKQFEIL